LKYLIDTGVLSQIQKSRPDETTMQWWFRQNATDLYLSAVVVHELRYGVELLPNGRKRENLEAWLTQQVIPNFQERILPVDEAIADLSGRILAAAKKAGHTAEANDTLIAATAKVHGLAVATQNRKHFERLGVELVEF
jgi:predicted nucleic acid-binding protein